MLHHFKKNEKGDDYVVGDIHGMYDMLMTALKDVGFDKSKDRLFSVGDIIDRGPDSIKCLALCYEPWFFTVRGNHEQMAFDFVIGMDDGFMWRTNGGAWYIDVQSDEIDATLHDLSERLPYGIEVETEDGLVGIVHADVMCPRWEDNFQNIPHVKEHILWSRSRVMGKVSFDVEGINILYVGHSPLDNPETIDNVRYIDTGSCFKDGYITIEKIS